MRKKALIVRECTKRRWPLQTDGTKKNRLDGEQKAEIPPKAVSPVNFNKTAGRGKGDVQSGRLISAQRISRSYARSREAPPPLPPPLSKIVSHPLQLDRNVTHVVADKGRPALVDLGRTNLAIMIREG
ncbi:hypothetical protein KM043_009447 [Ampulex compressa]|nr:hypothetical protein KM043_009447 [Ampulex compressa]